MNTLTEKIQALIVEQSTMRGENPAKDKEHKQPYRTMETTPEKLAAKVMALVVSHILSMGVKAKSQMRSACVGYFDTANELSMEVTGHGAKKEGA